ncbi:hypothetical protein RI367_003244 [Sorochytrium milnesiophthora]
MRRARPAEADATDQSSSGTDTGGGSDEDIVMAEQASLSEQEATMTASSRPTGMTLNQVLQFGLFHDTDTDSDDDDEDEYHPGTAADGDGQQEVTSHDDDYYDDNDDDDDDDSYVTEEEEEAEGEGEEAGQEERPPQSSLGGAARNMLYATLARMFDHRRRPPDQETVAQTQERLRQAEAAITHSNRAMGDRLQYSGEFGNRAVDVVGNYECKMRITGRRGSGGDERRLSTHGSVRSTTSKREGDDVRGGHSGKRRPSGSDDHHDAHSTKRAKGGLVTAEHTAKPISPFESFSANVSLMLRGRELKGYSHMLQTATNDRSLPNSRGKPVLHYSAKPYCGQFSHDGSLFYSCTQDFRAHVYDSSDVDNLVKVNTIAVPSHVSSDNRFIITSSISPQVYIAPTTIDDDLDIAMPNAYTIPVRLDFNNYAGGGGGFGIWSLRFSHDSREILAGTSVSDSHSPSVYVYDVESRRVLLGVEGHEDDVNAVCWADESSHVLYSGSDDASIKVWDRRSMSSSSSRSCGVLCGHTEGLTYLASKGDGRYCLSNGKDQTMKLWDIRKMMEPAAFNALPDSQRHARRGFDYRWEEISYNPLQRHKQDCSVLTMTGHSVLVTLIRCQFAPGAMEGRYFLSGSKDGVVRVWNLHGECVRELHTSSKTAGRQWRRESVVRDVSDE